ncbi:MAG: twin-arginine translocation signal domain-containing protein, partial [Planctomycetaceae bacterium]|nr:twin-arginine translocation signal domain-containing protein [Planctomycetaceae bacterium]
MTKSSALNRRDFIKTAAAASTVFSVPTIIPGTALGLNGTVAPSERIILGGIGIRRRGSYVLSHMLEQPDVRFVAIADVRADQRKAVKEMADKQNGDQKCDMYRDFRELLARD